MLPLQEGITCGRRLYGDEAAGPPLQRIKNGATLSDLLQDYALFTYAPLCIHGGLKMNPVQEWINANGHGQIVFILQLDEPYIHLGGNPIYDRTIWLVEKQYWESLCLHIGSMAFLNHDNKQLVRVICQDMPVPDVTSMRDLLGEARVIITTFSVDSNFGCLAFVPGTLRTQYRPQLKIYKPRQETIIFANALLTHKPQPYFGLQKPPWENEDENPDSSTSTIGSGD